MEQQLAKITSAKLSMERGILSFWIAVDYKDGCSQGIGGITLDEFSDKYKKRVGTAYGCEMIRRCLYTLSVDDFSEMVGKYIWVYGEGAGLSFKPLGFGPLSVDKTKKDPFIFEDVKKEFGI